MDHFDSHHRLLLISMFYIVSTLALGTKEAPTPTSFPGPSQTQEPKSSPTPSQFPKLIQVRTSYDAGNERGLHGKAPQSLPESFISAVPSSSPGPSPILMHVSFPNASPELSPTSPSIPPFPEMDPEEFEEYTDGGVQVFDALGPSPILMHVSSPNASPELSPTSPSIPHFPEMDSEEFEEYTDGGVQVSDAPRPSPILMHVFSPNASPELSPTSPSIPHFPEMDSEEFEEYTDGGVQVSDAPGPSPILMHVFSPNASPELSPTSPSIPPFPKMDSEEFDEYTDGGVQVSDIGLESEIEPNNLNSEEKGNPDTEVKKVCDSTDHPSLCFKSIFPLVKNQKETSANIVLDVSIKVANDLAKAATIMTKKLGITPGVPPEIASVLKDCADSYDNALDNFEQAKEAYATQDVGTLNTMLSAVITDISDCDDFFSTLSIPSPIAEFSEKLTNMTSNCLAIVSLLKS